MGDELSLVTRYRRHRMFRIKIANQWQTLRDLFLVGEGWGGGGGEEGGGRIKPG